MVELIKDIDNVALVAGVWVFYFSLGVLIIGFIWILAQLFQKKGLGFLNFIKINFNPILFSVLCFLFLGLIMSRGLNYFSFKYVWYTLGAVFLASIGSYWLNFLADKALENDLNLPLTFRWLSMIFFIMFIICISFIVHQDYKKNLISIEKSYVFNPPNVILDSLDVSKGDTLNLIIENGFLWLCYCRKVSDILFDLQGLWRYTHTEPPYLTNREKSLYNQGRLFNVYKTYPKGYESAFSDHIFPGLFANLDPSDTTRLSNKLHPFYFNKDLKIFYKFFLDKEDEKAGNELAIGFKIKISKAKSNERTKQTITSEIKKRFSSLYLLLFLFIIFVTNIKQRSSLGKEYKWLKDQLTEWGIRA